jgi:hypothetical protein
MNIEIYIHNCNISIVIQPEMNNTVAMGKPPKEQMVVAK